MSRLTRQVPGYLSIPLAIYFFASLIHFAHNAEYLSSYANLPPWLSRSVVYSAWLAETAIGAAGLLLLRSGRRITGLLVTVAYAGLGFAGLDHYQVGHMSAHTMSANATIWFEVAAAAALLAATLALLFRSRLSLPVSDSTRNGFV